MRIPNSNRFKKVTAIAGLGVALVFGGMMFQALPAAAADEDCTDFGYLEGFKADNLTETTYEWPAGYTVAVVKAGSDIQDLGHELVFSSETDPIVHSSGKELSHIHFCESPNPAITIDKKVGGGDHKTVEDALVAHEGDELDYTVLITNTGDTPLEITALVDSLSDAVPDSCSLGIGGILDPGDDFTCAYTMVATSADAHNVVSVTAEDVLGGAEGTIGGEDETFVRVIDPEIQVVKVASPETVEPGQDVTYAYEVTNIGDTDLVDVEVTDDILGGIGTVASLAPGDAALLTKTTTIQADSPRTNVATACGSDELGLSACDTDDATITIVLPAGPEGREGGNVLPASGFNLTLWIATGIALIATGLTLIQSKGEEEPV